MFRAYKYRLQPTKAQERDLSQTLYLCRELYNAALEERRTAYRKCGATVGYYQQKRSLKEIRADLPEYKVLHSQVLQNVMERLDKAFKGFFARLKRGDKPGFPRFQGRNRFGSFTYPQAGKTGAFPHPESGSVTLSGVGNVRCKYHRELRGILKTATVKREGSEWYVIFTTEVEPQPLPATGSEIGIDLGLQHLLVTSNGEFVDAPRYYQAAQKRLRRAQRSLSRKKRSSKRREKARVRVAKLHRKVKRQRADFLHKLGRKLVNENDLIAHEALSIQGLARSRLSKSVHDAAWGQLIGYITYKAESAGRVVVSVNPRFTSQDCSVCGHREKHPLWVREFICTKCQSRLNRDQNAAINIRGRACPSGANVVVVNARVA
jgi:putative transposase